MSQPADPPQASVEEIDPEWRAAMSTLWRLPTPGPENLLAAPELLRLAAAARRLYGPAKSQAGLTSALYNALRSLGLPCGLEGAHRRLALHADEAAQRLDAAFRATETQRVHLVPLDLADDIPLLRFGPARLVRYSHEELERLIDVERLARWGSYWTFDATRLSQMTWLEVRETVSFDKEPGHRALPVFYEPLGRDFGRIEPHDERFPAEVNAALFLLMLAPWEDWTEYVELDWRGFHAPWVYTVDADLFVRPPSPPAVAALSFVEEPYPDGSWGERPVQYTLRSAAAEALPLWLSDDRWDLALRARTHDLFSTPIGHFLVASLLTEGIDQFLHHVTLVEAALGLPHDYPKPGQPKAAVRPKVNGVERVAQRVAGLLTDTSATADFEDLFDYRSQYLHGRAVAGTSRDRRDRARRLARRVVAKLVEIAGSATAEQSRVDHLEAWLAQGLALNGRASRP